MIETIRILVDAGATLESAARAAVILERGGSTRDAMDAIVVAPSPLQLDAELLVAAAARATDRDLHGSPVAGERAEGATSARSSTLLSPRYLNPRGGACDA